MIRVALADDHPLVLEALRDLVDATSDLDVVAMLEDGDAVIAAVDAGLECDVLVLDLSLPGSSGDAVLSHLRAVAPSIRVLVYTMYPESMVKRGVMAAGAVDLVCKRDPPQEVLARIRQASSAEPSTPAYDEPAALHEALTARQQEVFLLTCEGAAPGDLVRRLDLSPSTVSSHLAAIRKQLGVESNGEILIYALNAGLLQ